MRAFVTGFPGFLGTSLVERLVADGRSVTCLVQPRYADRAVTRAEAIRDRSGSGDGVIELVTGDLTEPELGLAAPEEAAAGTDEVFHLAAVYELGMARDVGLAVNVEGTRRVLDFAQAADARRLHYVSTCYVSGRHGGVFGPDDLRVGQSFRNHYEETKFLAEAAVRERMAEGLPATIYRPSIVVGDSRTGETHKTDGPYYLLELVRHQPLGAVVPVQPGGGYTMDVVPRDFVVDAIATLADRDASTGEVYQLCNPDPPTVREIVRLFGAALDRRVVTVPVPHRATRRVLEAVPRLSAWLGVEPAAIDYLGDSTEYVRPNTAAALAGTDVACPPFASYVDSLVAYVADHPNLTDGAMV